MKKYLNLLKFIIFCIITCFIFILLQKTFIPKWDYPYHLEWNERNYNDFIEDDISPCDILFLGTSHINFSISPFMIYRDTGLCSYNLGSSGQTLDVSLFRLKESIRKQKKIKLVVLDVSSFFLNPKDNYSRDINLDISPISYNKLSLGLAQGNGFKTRCNIFNVDNWTRTMLPIVKYHNRWKELSSIDFLYKYKKSLYTTKGQQIFTQLNPYSSWLTPDESVSFMNERNIEYKYIDGKSDYSEYKPNMYNPIVYPENILYFEAIVNYCKQNCIDLLLVKVPTTDSPQFYSSTWTKNKSDIIKRITTEKDIKYLDLVYDYDVGIDWLSDTSDFGHHLNYIGGLKVTSFLEDYILNNYSNIQPDRNDYWEKQLSIFEKVETLIFLQLEYDFESYIDKLTKYDDNLCIFISSSDTGLVELTYKDKEVMSLLGLKTDFSKAQWADSYIAVIDSGIVKYESLCNRKQQYTYYVDNQDKEVKITSIGFLEGCGSSILIGQDKENISMNKRGLNFVIYDKVSGIIIDSLNFDTHILNHNAAVRNNYNIINYFRNYESFLIQKY